MTTPTFQAIREIPHDGIPEWEYAILSALKENLEILMGTRAQGVRALTAPVDTKASAMQTQQRITAQGQGYQANGSGILSANARVANVDDYVKLCQDVQTLMDDVGRIQKTLNALLNEFRS